ncbi:hypothetical protein QNI19_37000 [Cytophagaceae bacterium DM2B3-1]|uniref:Outer membrane protein beta-barrel domain-containing protein n=1 Tax=Xanthocytophaga flava TaxID=3048013 RepID=A0ABT7D097_9BACT|nr:hypothetical protein [Xanthocytophaga flavus]MDJ1498592.1 hypothetical protein [Xanthocytophaga flavus]
MRQLYDYTISLKLSYLVLLITVGVALEIKAQTPSDSLYTRRHEAGKKESPWVFAGNVSFQIKPLLINASPLLGYKFTDNLVAGLGPTYIYNKEGLVSPVVNSKPGPMHVYGGRVFVARRLYKPLFLQAETEALNYPYFDGREEKRRDWVVNPLAGVSLNMNTGGKSFFQITVLYNFNYNNEFNKQLYNSPWVFRLGAGLGGGKK